MRSDRIEIQLDVAVPDTGDEWELYTTMDSAACDEAAKDLADALVSALQFSNPVEGWRYWEARAREYAHLGACDTEPRAIARRIFLDIHPKF